MNNSFEQPLTLPCGAVLPNRIAKAAMTEGMADSQGRPTPELDRLYGVWSDGGAGLLLTGNVQIDSDHLERPGNVIVDSEPDELMAAALVSFSQAGTRNGNHLWAQIAHAGRQTPKSVNPSPNAPSAVKVGLPGGQFGQPVAMSGDDIEDVIKGFVRCAKALKKTGFTGVQIHSAHGYLLSEFLSPRTNLREDEYGGSLENRARVLLRVVKEIRAEVGPEFPIAVKLNSADFQKGGFAFEDSVQVAQWLEQASIDLIEISGGNYEQPKLVGMAGQEAEEPQNVAKSTLMREAYFVDFALAMQKTVSVPLMVTGGFRRSAAMLEALDSGAADVIGLGRPMCVDADVPQQLFSGAVELKRYEDSLSLLPSWLKFLEKISAIRSIAGFSQMYWFYAQLMSFGDHGKPDRDLSVFAALKKLLKHEKNWLASRAEGEQ